jgi:hypothetical protein
MNRQYTTLFDSNKTGITWAFFLEGVEGQIDELARQQVAD